MYCYPPRIAPLINYLIIEKKVVVVVVAVASAPTFTKLERKRFGAIAKYLALNVLLEKLPSQSRSPMFYYAEYLNESE